MQDGRSDATHGPQGQVQVYCEAGGGGRKADWLSLKCLTTRVAPAWVLSFLIFVPLQVKTIQGELWAFRHRGVSGGGRLIYLCPGEQLLMAVGQSTLIASPSASCPCSSLWGPVVWLEVGGGQAWGRVVLYFQNQELWPPYFPKWGFPEG